MRTVSDEYLAQVQGTGRQFGVSVKVYGNGAEPESLWLGDIISIDILRSCSDQLQIGACMSDMLTLETKATALFNGRLKKVEVFYRCTAPVLDWIQLGTFYVDEAVTRNGVTAVKAYDMMSRLDKRVSWVDTSKATAPTFPCKMQAMLNYLCARAGVTTDFTCEDITVEKAPDGYTAQELISYIAASHGRNARFSPSEVLKFPAYEEVGKTIQHGRCYSLDIAGGSGYTVKGILLQRGGDDKIYIDGTASEYDETADGIVTAYDPFATVGIAEYAWSKLGGLNYSAVSLEMPAENILEPGDVFTVEDADGTQKKAIVMEQELSLTCTGGFVEKISCTAESKAQNRSTENRQEATEKQIAGSTSAMTEYQYLTDASVKFNGTTYTIEKDADTGLISKISDSYNHEFKPSISPGITDVALHNAAFWALAMCRGLGEIPQKTLFDGTGGAWSYLGGLTGFRRIAGNQPYSGIGSEAYTSGAKVLRLSKSFGLADSEDNYTDAIIIRSNEQINLSGYSKLRILAFAFTNYVGLDGKVYFEVGEPGAAVPGKAYDFSAWKLVGNCDGFSTNYSEPGTPKWYEVDVSALGGNQYLNFGVYHGSQVYAYTIYFDIHKIILIP